MADGHKVTVYDTMYFREGHLPADCNVIKADIRDQDKFREACEGHDAVLYLASISNNAMCERDPALAQSVNVDAFAPCVLIARQSGVKRFVYASSVAVYGSSEEDSKESAPMMPTTLYAKAKAICEETLGAFQSKDFHTTIVRSASVCGYSPHQRFDLTVNMMTHDACRDRKIRVAGGQQKRSHIAMKDIYRFYARLLDTHAEKVSGQVFNAVASNQSVMDTAYMVARVVGNTAIETVARTDDRSYSVDGSKARTQLGWAPIHDFDNVVRDMMVRFDSGYWKDSRTNPAYMNMLSA